MGGSRGMLAAKEPLVVPMLLRLSNFRLNSYVVLVVSKQKGITLVFKTDPLQNVDINSTFDSITVIQNFIQREIEGLLRQMFREDLPGIIHRLSQQWVKAKVEAPYLNRRPIDTRQKHFETASNPDIPSYRIPRYPTDVWPSPPFRRSYSAAGMGRPRTASVYSASSVGLRSTFSRNSLRSPPPLAGTPATTPATAPVPDGPTSFPDLENFDPTYGLRPEGLPNKSLFRSFRGLFGRSKGLADLAEETSDVDQMTEPDTSFDTANWEDFLSDYDPPPPSLYEPEDMTEYERVPAVGGGTITRPRIIHSQSQLKTESLDGSQYRGTSYRSTVPTRANSIHSFDSFASIPLNRTYDSYNPYFAGTTPYDDSVPDLTPVPEVWLEDPGPSRSTIDMPPIPPLEYSPPRRAGSSSSLHTQPSRSSDMTHSIPTPPPADEDTDVRIQRSRRFSTSTTDFDRYHSGSPPDQFHMPEHDPGIILRPTLNSNTITKLSTLSHSNHTLSPYTRTLEHFTVRSVPPRDALSARPISRSSTIDRPPLKAKRKRTHRLGGAGAGAGGTGGMPKKDPTAGDPAMITSSRPPSPGTGPPFPEFDASEMDRYFRSRDDLIPRYPDLHPSHVRRRVPYHHHHHVAAAAATAERTNSLSNVPISSDLP